MIKGRISLILRSIELGHSIFGLEWWNVVGIWGSLKWWITNQCRRLAFVKTKLEWLSINNCRCFILNLRNLEWWCSWKGRSLDFQLSLSKWWYCSKCGSKGLLLVERWRIYRTSIESLLRLCRFVDDERIVLNSLCSKRIWIDYRYVYFLSFLLSHGRDNIFRLYLVYLGTKLNWFLFLIWFRFALFNNRLIYLKNWLGFRNF
jgi:hypothetical protein